MIPATAGFHRQKIPAPDGLSFRAHPASLPAMTQSVYTLEHSDNAARAGQVRTAHGVIPTPIFMPVGTVAEGICLRQDGLAQTILPLLGCQNDEDWQQASACGLTPLITGFEALEKAAALSSPADPWGVAIKLDTGMSRLGFSSEDIPALLERLRACPGLKPTLAVSHFPCADMPEKEDFTRRQLEKFTAMTDSLRAAYPALKRSLANSAGTMGWPESRFELCRPGFSLYGGNPFKKLFCSLFKRYVQGMERMLIEVISEHPAFVPPSPFEHTKALVRDVIGYGAKMGEGWLLTSEMLELAESGTENIVCTQPFGCLPNHICGKGMMKPIKDKNPNVNIVAIDYDAGATRVNQENRLKLMLANARANKAKKDA